MMSEWKPITTPDNYRMIIHNARLLMPKYKRKTANWILAKELFGCGSGYAWEICRYAKIDGDSFDVGEIWQKI